MLYFYHVLDNVESEFVWRALASPHRRTLLDLLRNGPKTTGELTKELPSLSRFAVMQHLGVLEEAGLVLFRREGRQRLNFANPIPLREMYERWVSSPASSAAETALHLKRYAEKETTMQENVFRLAKVELEMRVRAPRERVFAAFTDNYDAWWPHRYKADSKCTVDARPGGAIVENFADGGGAVTGTIVYIEPGKKLIATGPSSLCRGMDAYSVMTVEDDGEGGTLFRRSMELWGVVSEEMERTFAEGGRYLMEVALRGYLEEGKEYVAS